MTEDQNRWMQWAIEQAVTLCANSEHYRHIPLASVVQEMVDLFAPSSLESEQESSSSGEFG